MGITSGNIIAFQDNSRQDVKNVLKPEKNTYKMATSDSDSEGNLVVDDGNVVDDSICPICRGSTYIGETISCEKCEYWFHFECVGVTPDDPWVKNEDVPFFCSNCGGKPKKPIKKVATPKARKPKPKQVTPKPVTPKSTPKVATPKVQQLTPVATPKQSPLSSPPIKLKISLGKKKTTSRTIELSPPRQIPNKRKSVVESVLKTDNDIETVDKDVPSPSANKKRKRQNSEEEEEKWLDAVESGNLAQVDAELKTIRDPKLMTARQRAMVDRKNNDDYNDEDSGHMSLSYISAKKGSKAGSLVDEEETQRLKAIKSAKRKEIELEKREQDRIKTVERLLNKKESSTLKNTALSQTTAVVSSKKQVPKIVYVHRKEGPLLTFPEGMDIPISAKKPVDPPLPIKCSIENCQNNKKYSCSKTGKPLCSLNCYKLNSMMIATN